MSTQDNTTNQPAITFLAHHDEMEDGLVQTYDGREIHAQLEVGKDYTNWIKSQINSLHLIENNDYIIFAQKGEKSGRGRPRSEYHFTATAGKHIAMASRTDKGKLVREYFIACERMAIQANTSSENYITRDELRDELSIVVEGFNKAIKTLATAIGPIPAERGNVGMKPRGVYSIAEFRRQFGYPFYRQGTSQHISAIARRISRDENLAMWHGPVAGSCASGWHMTKTAWKFAHQQYEAERHNKGQVDFLIDDLDQ